MGRAGEGERHRRGLKRTTHDVVPAQAGTHIPEAAIMGPRLRGDDSGNVISNQSAGLRLTRGAEAR
jgi:hypothetical protein